MNTPNPNLSENDIAQMVQAVIDDDADAKSIKESLTESLTQLARGDVGRITYPPVVNIRKQAGLSQSQFAERLGISVNTLQSWEQGQRQPSGAAATLMRLLNNHPELVAELG